MGKGFNLMGQKKKTGSGAVRTGESILMRFADLQKQWAAVRVGVKNRDGEDLGG